MIMGKIMKINKFSLMKKKDNHTRMEEKRINNILSKSNKKLKHIFF